MVKSKQLWQVKGKGLMGRPKLFSNPQDLWDAACEYFKWADENPWVQSKTVSKGSGPHPGEDETESPTHRPYSTDALCIYLGTSRSFLKMLRKRCEGIDDAYVAVIDEIFTIIRTQQLEGAKIGAYNANLIARLYNIVDKTENTNHNTNVDVTPTKEEAQKIAKDLEDQC